MREIDGEEERTKSEGLFFLRKGLCFLEVETFEKLDVSNMKSFFCWKKKNFRIRVGVADATYGNTIYSAQLQFETRISDLAWASRR
jgi:hypothetical protein